MRAGYQILGRPHDDRGGVGQGSAQAERSWGDASSGGRSGVMTESETGRQIGPDAPVTADGAANTDGVEPTESVETAPVPSPAAVAAPADLPPPAVAEASAHPERWGRVDADGTVFVRTADGERPVGSWQAGDPAEGLAHYARRFDDIRTEVEL